MYEKCRACQYVCRCCSSHFMEGWPQCARCPGSRIEFEPAAHVKHCPIDGQKIKRPLFYNNGRIIMEE